MERSREDYQARPPRHSAHPSIVPFQALPAADGWLVVACAKEKFWRALCVAITQRRISSTTSATPDFAGRDEHREPLLAELYATFATRTVAEWVAILDGAGVPCGPVNDIRAALTDPQAIARDVVQVVEHPDLGTVRHIATAVRLSAGARPPQAAPLQGADTAAVLADLAGYDDEQIRTLIDQASGTTPGI